MRGSWSSNFYMCTFLFELYTENTRTHGCNNLSSRVTGAWNDDPSCTKVHQSHWKSFRSRLIDELLNHGRAFPALSFYFLGRTNLRCGLEELARLKISRFSSSASGEIGSRLRARLEAVLDSEYENSTMRCKFTLPSASEDAF